MKAFPSKTEAKIKVSSWTLDGDPLFEKVAEEKVNEGMDLRDYFAAKAMQAMLSVYEKGDSLKTELFADAAYLMADAMMKAREQ